MHCHHHAVRKLHRIALINHGKNISAVCCNLIGFQHFQHHLETWVIVGLSFPWNIIHMIEAQNPRVHLSGVTIAFADIFSLQNRHCLKAFGRCRFRFVDIAAVRPAINNFGRQVHKTTILFKCIRRKKVRQICGVTDRLSSGITPVIVGIVSSEKNNKIRVYIGKNFPHALAVVGEIIPFEDAAVLSSSIPLSGQQICLMSVFFHFGDQSIHQSALAAD